MNDTSGINVSAWVAPSGLHSLSSARPRALPWAGMVGPVGALKVARLEHITHKPIGVADYELTRALPAELASSLPSIETIEAELSADLETEDAS